MTSDERREKTAQAFAAIRHHLDQMEAECLQSNADINVRYSREPVDDTRASDGGWVHHVPGPIIDFGIRVELLDWSRDAERAKLRADRTA